MARPRQSLLTRQRIVDAAAALVDAEGLEAVSVRRLATELGVRGPSLYNHFATKAEIIDAVADAVVARVDVSAFGTSAWPDALRVWAHSYHAVLAAHPNIVAVLAHGPGRRPAALAMADTVYGALVRAGWPPARATHIGALMRYLVTGSALGSFALGFADDPQLYEQYPHLHSAHLLAGRRTHVDEGAFTLGLDLLIAGLRQQHRTHVENRSSELAREEIFGPVLSVIAFSDDDQAVQIADESRPHAPFRGHQQSGGEYGPAEFPRTKGIQR